MQIQARWALRFAAACSVLLGLLWFAAFHVGFVERADHEVFLAFYNLTYFYGRPGVHATATFLVSQCDPSHVAYLAVVPLLAALGRRRPYDACAVIVLLAGASVTTLVLKHLLPEPRVVSFLGVISPVPNPRFPSGHSTAAMALALSLTLVAPPRLRPLIAGLGAVFAATVGCSLLTLGSHFPSDVFAGFLVAVIWSLLVVAGLVVLEYHLGTSASVAAEPSRPISIREALKPSVAALVAIVAAAAIVLLSDPQSVVSYVRANNAILVGAVVIAALSTALSTGVVLSARPDVRR